jgi:glycerol-3-phosphate acyltransferase PlsY
MSVPILAWTAEGASADAWASIGGAWVAIALAYLVGSIPFGLVLVRLVKGIDIRSVGSGNIGATNAARAGGRGLGLAVFLCDFAKGWLAPAVLAAQLGRPGDDRLAVACGAAAVLGHCFPVYLRFQGGKGVATGCGALVALDWRIFLAGGAVWMATAAATRFAGLASILMGVAFPVAAWWLAGDERPELTWGAGLLTVLILLRHRSNISRMLAGTEPRMGAKRGSGT